MINPSREAEALAEQLATEEHFSVEARIQRALEAYERVAIEQKSIRSRRMTVENMLTFGSEIIALPLLDHRSQNEIMDDINAL